MARPKAKAISPRPRPLTVTLTVRLDEVLEPSLVFSGGTAFGQLPHAGQSWVLSSYVGRASLAMSALRGKCMASTSVFLPLAGGLI